MLQVAELLTTLSTVFTRNDAAASINFTAVEGGDNSNTSSDIISD